MYGLVYVVDGAAASRIAENMRVVEALSEAPDLIGKPILFFLNKKDLPDSLEEIQFSELFKLHNMTKKNKADIRVVGLMSAMPRIDTDRPSMTRPVSIIGHEP